MQAGDSGAWEGRCPNCRANNHRSRDHNPLAEIARPSEYESEVECERCDHVYLVDTGADEESYEVLYSPEEAVVADGGEV